jgi:hypothetical protein
MNQLSARQIKLFWNAWFLGDGSRTSKDNGDVIYCSLYGLISSLQSIMTIGGFNTSLRGPYDSETKFGKSISYHLYLPDDQEETACVGFGRIGKEYPIQERHVKNVKVVCFEVDNGTLVTRNAGKISIQGNCKFAYHIFRLADQAKYILINHDLDLQEKGRREKMKAIRRGEVTFKEIMEGFSEAEKQIDSLYETSKLPYSPDENQIKNLLLTVLEHHFGSIDKAFKGENRYQKALNEIQDICRKYGI